MSSLAPTLQAFFTDRLMAQQQASPETIAAYRDTFRLLLGFAQQRTGKKPSQLVKRAAHADWPQPAHLPEITLTLVS